MTTSRSSFLLTLCGLAAATGAAAAQTLVTSAAPQTTVLEARPQAQGVPAAAPPSAPREPIRIKGPVRIAPQGPAMETGVDSLDLDFAGAGADALRQRARPAPVALRSEARRLIAAEAKAEDCDTYPDGDRVFFADFDGDGGPEGLALYTVEGCGGGGNNYTRGAMVLRESPTQGWTKVSGFTLGTKLVGERKVTGIGGGTLSLDGSAGPETVRIPPAGR